MIIHKHIPPFFECNCVFCEGSRMALNNQVKPNDAGPIILCFGLAIGIIILFVVWVSVIQ